MAFVCYLWFQRYIITMLAGGQWKVTCFNRMERSLPVFFSCQVLSNKSHRTINFVLQHLFWPCPGPYRTRKWRLDGFGWHFCPICSLKHNERIATANLQLQIYFLLQQLSDCGCNKDNRVHNWIEWVNNSCGPHYHLQRILMHKHRYQVQNAAGYPTDNIGTCDDNDLNN